VSEPIATWNRARGAWETPTLNLLCGHLEPFSQTWPKSGSMRNGSVFPRPVPVPAISAGASSSSPGLLPTPTASNPNDGESLESWEARRQRNLAKGYNGNGQGTPLAIAAMQLLPTPRASANENRQTKRTPSQEAGDHGLCLAAEVLELLPGGGQATCAGADAADTDRFGRDRGAHEPERGPEWGTAACWHRQGAFGRYEAAVRRHERVFGRLAPAPVEPARNGNPRLSARFSEWMMGLPDGWVTGVPGLSRNAQLKAIGDGVMPAQAAMALRMLLERAGIPSLVAEGDAA